MVMPARNSAPAFTSAILALVCAAGLVWPGAAAADEPAGRFLTLAGTVTVLRDGAELPATHGAVLLTRDRIATASASRALIELPDGTTVTLGEQSRVSLAHILVQERAGPARSMLDLVTGIIRLVTPATRDDVHVRTRSAVASVRGTEWIVESGPERDSVLVQEGSVTVEPRIGTVLELQAGEGTDIPHDGPPSPPAVWGEARVQDVLARTSPP